MPNPLFLEVAVDAKGDITLNSENQGNLADFDPIKKRLLGVFKDREDNAVLRPGNNEIEKTVSIRLAPERKVSDLDEVAKAVADAGSDRLFLMIDPPDFDVTIRKSLFSSPKPKRKTRKHH